MGASPPAVDCRHLVVRYGSLTAVADVSFAAHHGRVLAVLGPNGAGKTSTVETLEGYRVPSAGTVRVLGLDPRADHRALVGRIGVMLQRGGVHPTMTPRQAVRLYARYYRHPDDPDGLVDRVGLTPVADTPWRRLSGGEQQRLSLALALVGRPEVLFLDEPTAGVDPEGRQAIRQVVAERRQQGCCVLLTTHELAEAERMADEVLILQSGQIVAHGTPAELAARSTPTVRFRGPAGLDCDGLARAVGVGRDQVAEMEPGAYQVRAADAAGAVTAIAAWLTGQGLPVTDLRAGDSLEDVYLRLTGAETPAAPPAAPVRRRARPRSPGRRRSHEGGRSRAR